MAAPVIAAAVIGAGAQIGGGLMGANALKKAQAQEKAYREAALNIANSLKVPTAEAEKLLLEDPKLVWEFIPEETKAFLQEASAMEDISVDPRLKEAQMSAIEGIRSRAEGEGLTQEDLAEFQQLRRGTARQAEARDASILQNLAERGLLSGSGQELALRQKSSQDAMLAQAEQADRIAAESAQAKRDALSQLGTFGTQMRSQEFGEQADIARAKDVINQFNVRQQQEAMNTNVAARNIAAKQYADYKQQLEAQRAANRSSESQWGAEGAGRRFGYEAQKAGLQIGSLTGMAQGASQQGQTKAGMYQAMGSGLADIAGSAAKAYASYQGSGNKDISKKSDLETPKDTGLDQGQAYSKDGGIIEKPEPKIKKKTIVEYE